MHNGAGGFERRTDADPPQGCRSAQSHGSQQQLLENRAMIQISPQMRILVAVNPADFRCGIDGLARICREHLQENPFSGALYVFRNRRGTAIKVLTYDSC
jgi:transposase